MFPHVEVGVQVNGSFASAGDVVASTLPSGLAATATHTGPIARIGDTHQAVCEWSRANGYRLAGPRWEIYGDPDPSTGDFDVEVFWSLLGRTKIDVRLPTLQGLQCAIDNPGLVTKRASRLGISTEAAARVRYWPESASGVGAGLEPDGDRGRLERAGGASPGWGGQAGVAWLER